MVVLQRLWFCRAWGHYRWRERAEPSDISTLSAAPSMDGGVVAPADHDHTNGPRLMDQPWPVWADWPAPWPRASTISQRLPGMWKHSLTEMESITPAPEIQEGGGAVVTSLGLRVIKSKAAFPEASRFGPVQWPLPSGQVQVHQHTLMDQNKKIQTLFCWYSAQHAEVCSLFFIETTMESSRK